MLLLTTYQIIFTAGKFPKNKYSDSIEFKTNLKFAISSITEFGLNQPIRPDKNDIRIALMIGNTIL
jgi:hypothetical protein